MRRKAFLPRLAVVTIIALVAAPLTATPANATVADATIMEIQGGNHQSPLVGQNLTTKGVVTAVAFGGFYLQDPVGDGNPNTSDGIYVNLFRPPVTVGETLYVTGDVEENIAGGPATGNLSTTRLNNVTLSPSEDAYPFPTPVEIGTGGILPSATTVISDDELPINLQTDPANFDPQEDAIDFWEALEGMFVEVDRPVAVSATRTFNAFSSEFFSLPSRGGSQVVEPNDARTSRGGIQLQPDPDNLGDQNPERVQLQFDGTIYQGASVPLVKVGDRVNDAHGVVGYSFGNYEVNVTDPLFINSQPLSREVSDLKPGQTNFTLASYNVLNLAGDGSDVGQMANLAGQIVDHLNSPDVIALQEIQDNSGQIDDGTTSADLTLDALVAAIAAAGGPMYQWADVAPADGTSGGIPGGNIRNSYLYNSDRVGLTDLFSLTPAALTLFGADPGAFDGTRVPLVGVFDFNGNTVTVINNHSTSRFGSTPIFGGPQPFVQAGEVERGQETQAINDVVDTMLAADPGALIAAVGDFNTFEWTDELTETLPGQERVLTNLITSRLDSSDADAAYSFIFDGNSQQLDHIFVTDDLLARRAKVDVVHVNLDFPRVSDDYGSDHEPLLAKFTLPDQRPTKPFTLQVLHASDLEGGIEALELAPNFAGIIDGLEERDDVDATVTLSAGDNYIPGPFFSASGDRSVFRDGGVFNDVYSDLFGVPYDSLREGGGRVDISIMNVIGFDASAVGNHEFDLGSDTFESVIEEDFRSPAGPSGDRWVGSQFPYLSSNYDFSADGDLGNLFTSDILPNTAFQSGVVESASNQTSIPKIAPSTFIEVGDGERIGVVGATTPLLATISSPGATTAIGPTTDDMPALAAVIQPTVDALAALGINKIILVSHLQQIALETELAGLLSGVDVIIAGGSDTLLANPDDVLFAGDSADDVYPVETTNADGDPLAIVSTDGEYSYVGQLTVSFDSNGVINAPFDPADNGPIASTEANAIAANDGADPFAPGTKGELVERLVDAVTGVVIAKDGNVLGETTVFLEGRREKVRTEETNLGYLGALANMVEAQKFDPSVSVSIKNGGGLRAEIGEIANVGGSTQLLPPQANPLSGRNEGEISQLAIENSLRFNNGLTLLTLTATELQAVIEHAVAATGPGNTPGQFGQFAGLEFSYDPNLAPGSRVVDATIVDNDGNFVETLISGGAIQGDATRTFRIVTLNFLAGGGDSYPFPATDRVDLTDVLTDAGAATFSPPGGEQDALAEYLLANHSVGAGTPFSEAETPPSGDTRIIDLSLP